MEWDMAWDTGVTQPHLPIPAAVWPDADERFEIIETPGITGIEGEG
jgi:hypothetical protein